MVGLRECNECGYEDKRKNLKRVNNSWLCEKCYSKKRKDRREFIKRNIIGIRKREDLEKEWEEKRKQAKKEYKIPKINGEKKRTSSNKTHFYLTREEKQFLYKKYISLGYDSLFAKDKIERDIKFLSGLVIRLREERKTDEEINQKFKECFGQLIQ